MIAPYEFYEKLVADNGVEEFKKWENNPQTKGLTPFGWESGAEFRLSDFNPVELYAAYECVVHHLKKYKTRHKINRNVSSYGLKHVVEEAVRTPDTKLGYVSNGTMILAMLHAGFEMERIEGSPNCHFNVTQKSLDTLFKKTNAKNQ